MKKRFLMATAVASALMLSACDGLFGGDEVTVTVTDTANVRDAPTTDGSNVIGKLEAGTELSGEWVETVTGAQSKWLEFEYNGRKAFVWAGNLKGERSKTEIKASSTVKSEKPSFEKYKENSDFKIARAAVRCFYFFQTLRVAAAYSYSHHDELAPYMITPEYLNFVQSSYEEEFLAQKESHRKTMNETKYINLFANIFGFYSKKAGLSEQEKDYFVQKVAPIENKDILLVNSLFTEKDLSFEQYSDGYKILKYIGNSIDCAPTRNSIYREFVIQY